MRHCSRRSRPDPESALPASGVEKSDLRKAAEVIRAGGIVAYPTESCYGLGCDPRQHAAVRRLLRLKRRCREQGLILISARLQQLLRYIDCDEHQLKRAVSAWPGPVTWLMPARDGVSCWLTGNNPGIAVRVTAHRGAAALCQYTGIALVSTSANRHGRPPAESAAAVHREFGDNVDYVLAGNLGGSAKPSEIRDVVTNRVVRSG